MKDIRERLSFVIEGIRVQEGFNWHEYAQVCTDALASLQAMDRGVERLAALAATGADLQHIYDTARDLIKDLNVSATVLANSTPTRLERIMRSLLIGDYVKDAFLEPENIGAMARRLELQLDTVAKMTDAEAKAQIFRFR